MMRIASPISALQLLDPERHREGVAFFRNYFSVIGCEPGIFLLESILKAFSHLPWENLSKIIKHSQNPSDDNKLRLPLEIMEDHSRYQLGGTCFSLTFMLQMILIHSGFACYPVMADMKAGRNKHCALVVLLDSAKYLVDPGYLLTQPMEMNSARPRIYHSEHTGVELVFHPDCKMHDFYTFNRAEMKWRYRFSDRAVPPDEFLKHWQSSFYWNSMHGLCLTKVENGKMLYFHKTYMRETSFGGKKTFNAKHCVHQTISEAFGIRSEWVESALSALQVNMSMEQSMGLWIPPKQDVSH